MEYLSKLFSKKIGRGIFALNCLALVVIMSLLIGLWGTTNLDLDNINPFGGVVFLVAFSYLLLIATQRLNDLEWSKWYLLLYLIPGLSFFILIALLGRKGVNGQKIEKRSTGKNKMVSNNDVKEVVKQTKETNLIKKHGNAKYCGSCGTERVKDAKFCSSCGESFA